jgi:hypothetical protein
MDWRWRSARRVSQMKPSDCFDAGSRVSWAYSVCFSSVASCKPLHEPVGETMFQASFKVQSAGAIIAAVMWATAATAPALGQAKHEEIAIGYASRSCVMTPLHVAQEQQTWPRSKGVALAPRDRAGGGADAGRGYRADGRPRRCPGGSRDSRRRHRLYRQHIQSPDLLYLFTLGNHPSRRSQRRLTLNAPEISSTMLS